MKNPQAKQRGQIYFHDIGDYLSREDKLEKIASYASVAGVPEWQTITPDDHGDWLKQRDGSFEKFIALGDKGNKVAATLDLSQMFVSAIEAQVKLVHASATAPDPVFATERWNQRFEPNRMVFLSRDVNGFVILTIHVGHAAIFATSPFIP